MKNFLDIYHKYFNSTKDFDREAEEIVVIPGLKKFWDYFWSFELPQSCDDAAVSAGTTAAAFAVSWAQEPMKAFLAWLSLECDAYLRKYVFEELHDYASLCYSSGDAIDLCMLNDANNLLKRLLEEGFPVPSEVTTNVIECFNGFHESRSFKQSDCDYLGHWYTLWHHSKDTTHSDMRQCHWMGNKPRFHAWARGATRALRDVAGPLTVERLDNGFTRISNRGYDVQIKRLDATTDNKVFFVVIATTFGSRLLLREFEIGPVSHRLQATGHQHLLCCDKDLDSENFHCRIFNTEQMVEFKL